MKASLLIFLLAFGPAAFAGVNFVEYVKRNYRVLKKSESKPEVTAFKEINPYRGIASTPAENQAPETKSSEPQMSSGAEGGSSEASDSNSSNGATDQGPNK